MGLDSESHYDEWWHSVTTEPSNQTSTASVCETLNLYKQEKPPSDPKIAILDWSSSSQRVTTQNEVTIKSVSGLNTEEASVVLRLLH